MKKLFLIPFLALTIFLKVNRVNALDNLYLSSFYSNYPSIVSNSETYSNNIDYLIDYYSNNLSSSFPYYVIDFGSDDITLWATNTNYVYAYSSQYNDVLSLSSGNGTTSNTCYVYHISSDTYTLDTDCHGPGTNVLWYSSNTTLIFKAGPNNNNYSSIQLPSYSNLSLDVAYPLTDINDGDILPTYISLTNGIPSADFTRVDLSEYDYIVLNLKDYDTTTFNTTIYSLGRLCFTPVYDYGMTQKSEMIVGYQNQACTEYYNTLTPVMITIIQADLDNHAVYYIKRYGEETNIVEIPTSIFDITYVTDANAGDPQVTINGRSYPVTKFGDLTDTANNSTSEGYVSGQVCALGDVNCYYSAKGMDFDDVFTQPLKTLKSLWSSISLIFNIITEFISLLPPILQSFLFVSFMICVTIGILRLVLGAI